MAEFCSAAAWADAVLSAGEVAVLSGPQADAAPSGAYRTHCVPFARAGLGQKFSCHGKRFCVCLGSRLTNPPNTLAKAGRGSGVTVG